MTNEEVKHDGPLYQPCTPNCPAPPPHKYEEREAEDG